jgi:hypothetical protein
MSRPVDRWRVLWAAASIWILIAAAGGCGKNTVAPETPDTTHYHYLPPSSPQNVLQNLVTAYNDRDSVQTGLVYDVSYIGTGATDPSVPDPLPDFTRQAEIRHVGHLKIDPNIVSVFLDLGPPTSWQRLPAPASDPPGWAIIQLTSSTVRIEDIGRSATLEAHDNVMEFTFKPTVTPPDTTWTVVHWVEIAN